MEQNGGVWPFGTCIKGQCNVVEPSKQQSVKPRSVFKKGSVLPITFSTSVQPSFSSLTKNTQKELENKLNECKTLEASITAITNNYIENINEPTVEFLNSIFKINRNDTDKSIKQLNSVSNFEEYVEILKNNQPVFIFYKNEITNAIFEYLKIKINKIIIDLGIPQNNLDIRQIDKGMDLRTKALQNNLNKETDFAKYISTLGNQLDVENDKTQWVFGGYISTVTDLLDVCKNFLERDNIIKPTKRNENLNDRTNKYQNKDQKHITDKINIKQYEQLLQIKNIERKKELITIILNQINVDIIDIITQLNKAKNDVDRAKILIANSDLFDFYYWHIIETITKYGLGGTRVRVRGD